MRKEYSLKTILPGITLLYGFREECCIYVVEGENKVALIDTGMGTGDITKAIEAIAPGKEVVVFNTHCHFDHSAGNGQFAKVCMHPGCYADQDETLSSPVPREVEYDDLPKFDTERVPVKEGDLFDLGGVCLEVIETPGHTPGDICLLDRTHRVIFGGDCIGTTHHNVWMMESLPWVKFSTVSIECFLRSLQKLKGLDELYDGFLGGHDDRVLGKEYLDELISLCEEIIAGTDRWEKYLLPVPPEMGEVGGKLLKGKTLDTAILYQDDIIFDKK